MRRRYASVASASLVAMLGCGVPVGIQSSDPFGAFPHAQGYSRLHMDDALEDDTACLECHGVDEDEQIVGSPALHCSLCHTYPPFHFGEDE